MSRTSSVTIPIVALALIGAGWWHARQRPEPAGADAAERLRIADRTLPVPRAFYGRRLEPKEGVLHGAGQSDESSFAAYTKAVAPARPMLSMSYVDLHDDIPTYFTRLHTELARYPDFIIPQIGLSLNAGEARKHYDSAVATGLEDAHLQQICDGIRSLDRPVFLRVGYEFNGSWNGYSPASYIAAFRHVAQSVRTCGLDNVALVWDWSAGAELDAEEGGASADEANRRYMAFYPGDAWVDWWGINIFGAANLWSKATATFLHDATQHRMPVMIGESTPKGHSVTEGERLVSAWYRPYFGLIRSSPGVKAFCYINWDWSIYPQWADWGDARVEANSDVLKFYRGEVSQALYAGARDRTSTLKLLSRQVKQGNVGVLLQAQS